VSIQFHSLYAGIICVVLLLALRAPLVSGLAIIPICVLIESGQFSDRLKSGRNPWQYAGTSVLQSVIIASLFVLVKMCMFVAAS
jgi:hypothetical protein